jgi:hypothetical protein
MKSFLTILSAMLMTFAVIGCGGGDDAAVDDTAPATPAPEDMPGAEGETPAAEGEGETPAAEGEGETPAAEGEGETPAAEGEGEKPAAE